MKKYIVNIAEIHVLPINIEASSENDARQKVWDMLSECEIDFDRLEYSHTLNKEQWSVNEILNK